METVYVLLLDGFQSSSRPSLDPQPGTISIGTRRLPPQSLLGLQCGAQLPKPSIHSAGEEEESGLCLAKVSALLQRIREHLDCRLLLSSCRSRWDILSICRFPGLRPPS